MFPDVGALLRANPSGKDHDMTILVTGASGHLGRLIIQQLLAHGVDAAEIVAGARTPAAVADLGVRAVAFDYDDPDTLRAGLAGVDRLVLVSGSVPGGRVAQHRNVIDAAVQAGVSALAYTSIYGGDSALPLAPEHVATEALIAASGIPHVLLRNNWYIENYVRDVAGAAETGTIAAAVGDARVAGAARVDFAEAAAVAITDDAYLGRTLELAGDAPFSYADLAAAASEIHGRDVQYVPLTPEQQRETLLGYGLDEGTVEFVVALDAGIAAGALDSGDRTLSQIIGRPTTPLVEGLRAAL
jgi:NAD(P)H dehydrogenase (quinone)